MRGDVLSELKALADPIKAAFLPRFFKTGKGEYAEGDAFIGVSVPQMRSVVKNHLEMDIKSMENLLRSPLHECRLTALLIMVEQYKRGDAARKKKIATLYKKNMKYVNNWDLVDSSAPYILAPWMEESGDTRLLDTLAASKNLWKQRMSIVATQHFIRKNEFSHTFRIAKVLLHHPHDLIHKAVGWMLREVGKRDLAAEEKFLKKYYKTMPRTMLRYAIERFDKSTYKKYLSGAM